MNGVCIEELMNPQGIDKYEKWNILFLNPCSTGQDCVVLASHNNFKRTELDSVQNLATRG